MLALAAGHRVVAIGAFSANIALIKLSARLNDFPIDGKQFTLIHSAVGSPPGYCDLVSGNDNVADGMLACSKEELDRYNDHFGKKQGIDRNYYKPREQVPVAHLDSLVSEKIVDVLKIDIEGHEPQALGIESAQSFFASTKVSMIFTEFIPWVIRSSGLEPNAYLELLENWGFRCDHKMSALQVERAADVHAEFDLRCAGH